MSEAKCRTHEILDAAHARGDKTTLLAVELLQLKNCKDGLVSLIVKGPSIKTWVEMMMYDDASAKAMANIAQLFGADPTKLVAAMKLLDETSNADVADIKAGNLG